MTIMGNLFVGGKIVCTKVSQKSRQNVLTPPEVLSFQIPTLFILLQLLVRVTIILYVHYIKPWASQSLAVTLSLQF